MGAVLLLQYKPESSYGRGHWPGVRWLCVLPLLSVRNLSHPGPTPPLARIFLIFWRALRFSVALVTVVQLTVVLFARLDAAVLELHTIRPSLLPSLAVMSNNYYFVTCMR